MFSFKAKKHGSRQYCNYTLHPYYTNVNRKIICSRPEYS